MQRQHRIRHFATALAIASGVVVVTAGVRAQEHAHEGKTKVDPKINETFRNPDPKAFVKRFESESREPYARRHEIVAQLELKPGMAAADIGAGTGFFSRLMAEKVGPKGKVYAVDVAKPFLKHIEAEARKQGLNQIVTVLGSQDSTNLPPDSVDVVFFSDVYHHLEHPQKTLATIHRALHKGGRLVIVEFDRVEGRSSGFVLKHIRAGQDVFRKEIESAGFVVIPTPNPPKLKENFFLRFEKKG